MTDRTPRPVGLDQATLALEQFSGAVELFAEKAIRGIGGVAIGETGDKDIERIHRLADIAQKYSDLMDRIFAEVNAAITRAEGYEDETLAAPDSELITAVLPEQEIVITHKPVSEPNPNEVNDENAAVAARAAAIEQMIQQLQKSQRTMHIGELVRAVFGIDYQVEKSQFRLFIHELNAHPAVRHIEGPYYQIVRLPI